MWYKPLEVDGYVFPTEEYIPENHELNLKNASDILNYRYPMFAYEKLEEKYSLKNRFDWFFFLADRLSEYYHVDSNSVIDLWVRSHGQDVPLFEENKEDKSLVKFVEEYRKSKGEVMSVVKGLES